MILGVGRESGPIQVPGVMRRRLCRPGKRIRLVTELPLERSEAELLSQQDGACAGCGAQLHPAEPQKRGFLRSIAASKPKQVRSATLASNVAKTIGTKAMQLSRASDGSCCSCPHESVRTILQPKR